MKIIIDEVSISLLVGRMIGRIIAITVDSDNEVYVSYDINAVLQCCQ